jgi:hypothetical protein
MVLMECGCHCRASFSAHVRLQLPIVWSMLMEARVAHASRAHSIHAFVH